MKKLIPLFFLFALFACAPHEKTEPVKDRFYFVTTRDAHKHDTTYIEKIEWVDSNRRFIARVNFCYREPFCGEVTKYDKPDAAIDGETVTYQTRDLGIIYELSTTWKSYKRLHSTNDSIERRISEYIDHILSRSELVIEGDIPLKYYDKIGPRVLLK